MAEPAMIMVDTSSVFMCKQCNVILAEGRDASEYCEQLNVIACLRATAAVRVGKEVNYHLSAEMQDCVHTRLICKICSTNVGLFLTTAVSEFAHLREMFCFWRTAIVCYSMETGQLVEGSQINVNVSQCVTELKNLEDKICNTYKSIMELSKLLRD